LRINDVDSIGHSGDTPTLSNYFDAVDLQPGGRRFSWLIFEVPMEDFHLLILVWNSPAGRVAKRIAIP